MAVPLLQRTVSGQRNEGSEDPVFLSLILFQQFVIIHNECKARQIAAISAGLPKPDRSAEAEDSTAVRRIRVSNSRRVMMPVGLKAGLISEVTFTMSLSLPFHCGHDPVVIFHIRKGAFRTGFRGLGNFIEADVGSRTGRTALGPDSRCRRHCFSPVGLSQWRQSRQCRQGWSSPHCRYRRYLQPSSCPSCQEAVSPCRHGSEIHRHRPSRSSKCFPLRGITSYPFVLSLFNMSYFNPFFHCPGNLLFHA